MLDNEEKQLLAELRALPDFESFPLPAKWYKQDKSLKPPSAVSSREFMESNYTFKCSVAPKDLPMINIRVPQQGGKLVDAPKVEEIMCETISRPFTLQEIPDVLPSLIEIPE